MDRTDRKKLYFDAVLHPHASLGRRGFLALMLFVSGVSFTAGLAFFLMGAWPVVGFFGLDVLLIYIAFRVSFRRARLYETVELSDSELAIRRHLPNGQVVKWTFQPYWARVELIGKAIGGPLLAIRSHGKYLVFGSFLTADERSDFADALREALDLHRGGHRFTAAAQLPDAG